MRLIKAGCRWINLDLLIWAEHDGHRVKLTMADPSVSGARPLEITGEEAARVVALLESYATPGPPGRRAAGERGRLSQ